MENVDTLNLSSDKLGGLLSLLVERKLQQVLSQGAKSLIDEQLRNESPAGNSTTSAGNAGDPDVNVSGSSLSDQNNTVRELLEKAGKCKKANPAQQIFWVSKLWFYVAFLYRFYFQVS